MNTPDSPEFANEMNPNSRQSLSAVGTIVQGLIVLAYYSYVSKPAAWTTVQSFRPLLGKVENLLQEAEIPLYDYSLVVEEFLENHVISETCEQLHAFFDRVHRWRNELVHDTEMAPMLVKMLEIAKRMSAGSKPAFNEIKDNIGLFKNRDLINLFVSKEKPNDRRIKATMNRMRELVGYLGGQGTDLTADQRKVARDTKPNMYNDFLTLRRNVMSQAKNFVQNWVRTHGDENGLVDYQQLLGELNQYFPIHDFPSGFIGKIDDMSRPYTSKGQLVQNFPRGGVVIMNPDYNEDKDDSYVFRSRAANAEGETHHYTIKNRAKSKRNIFKTVEKLGEKIAKVRKKWIPLIKNIEEDPTDEQQFAMILEIIYHTQARIGSARGSTKVDGQSQKTFGLSVIQFRHLRFTGDRLLIKYLGKAAKTQRHILTKDMGKGVQNIIDTLKLLKSKYKPTDSVFVRASGAAITGQHINAYLRQLGAPPKATIHKFRHLKGVQMMNKIIENHPFKDKPATSLQVKRWLQKEAESIGEQLGHFSGEKVTGNTALQNYVSPKSLIHIYKEAQALPHPSLLKILNIDPKTVDMEGKLSFEDLHEDLETATIDEDYVLSKKMRKKWAFLNTYMEENHAFG